MKKFDLVFNALLVPIDYLVLLGAATASYFLRFESFVIDIRPVVFDMELSEYIKIAYIILIAFIAIFIFSGLYSFRRKALLEEIRSVLFAVSTATLIIVIAFFFDANLFSSRFIVLAFWVLAIIFIVLERIIVFFVKKLFYRNGIGIKRIVIVGQDNNTLNLIGMIKHYPSYGFRVVEHLRSFTEKDENYLATLRTKVVIDEVVQADVNLPLDQKEALLNYCQENQIGFKYIASLLQTKMINFSVSTMSGVPMIEIMHTSLDGWGRIIKRFYDIVLSFVGCILLLPISLIVGMAIKSESKGPLFVKLTRVGVKGSQFNLYKYRSMIDNAHDMKKDIMDKNERADGPLFKMQNDPRVTKVGKFIRKWSIDELPQLFNVLKGDMSIVGPRPHEPEEVEKYAKSQRKLLTIKSGITGMAQVSGRSNLQFDDEVKLDSYYIENWSAWLDLQILVKTIFVVLLRKGSA
jgi:exopolysaccharide biosynthesis polyprenyl glycosylphosphotransferase